MRPVPTAVKRLNGNPGKRALNEREPQPRRVAPKRPGHLTKRAQGEWRRLVKILAPMGVLTEAEADVLAVYVQAYDRWVQASEALDRDGMVLVHETNGLPMRSPWLRVQDDALRVLMRCMGELGLTPGSRVRLRAPDDHDDAFDAWLAGSNGNGASGE